VEEQPDEQAIPEASGGLLQTVYFLRFQIGFGIG